jgi:ArsR family transcriptional regulator
MPSAIPKPVTQTSAEAIACTFKALADPARLRILHHLVAQDAGCCLPGEDVCACDLETVTQLSQPTVSHHMKCLISARLVIAEKRGKWMYYRIDPKGFDLIKEVLPQIGG